MERQEFINIVNRHLKGQGSAIDVASKLPDLLIWLADALGTIGDLASLDTDHKSDLVSALNEVADLVESPHYVISLSTPSADVKAIYEACAENLTLAKNIVFYNSTDSLYYRVNGYNMVNDILKLHTIMKNGNTLMDVVIGVSPSGTLSVE